MCKNHSHFTAKKAGVLLVGPTRLLELEVTQPLEVQMPSGERWIHPCGMTLYLPLSTFVPLQVGMRRRMVVSYIRLYSMAGDETITMLETRAMQKDAGDCGLMKYADMELSAHPERKSDEY